MLRLRVALLAIGLLAIAGCAPTGEPAAQPPATETVTGTTAPTAAPEARESPGAADRPVAEGLQFTADLVGGGQLEGGDLAGRDVVLWFWAPW